MERLGEEVVLEAAAQGQECLAQAASVLMLPTIGVCMKVKTLLLPFQQLLLSVARLARG
jgi:hypothetical protein